MNIEYFIMLKIRMIKDQIGVTITFFIKSNVSLYCTAEHLSAQTDNYFPDEGLGYSPEKAETLDLIKKVIVTPI